MNLDQLTEPEVRKYSSDGRHTSEEHRSWLEKAPTAEI